MIDTITARAAHQRLRARHRRGIFQFRRQPGPSHERYARGARLVIRAWTRARPLRLEGKHYHYEYVNVWPRPFQQPHPPIWVPSMVFSRRSSSRRIPTANMSIMQNFNPFERGGEISERLPPGRAATAMATRRRATHRLVRAGLCRRRPSSRRWTRRARRIEFLFNQCPAACRPNCMFFPPGYMSPNPETGTHPQARPSRRRPDRGFDRRGIFICGSPDTVRRRIADARQLMGFQEFIAMLHSAFSGDLTERNIRRFAADVLHTIRSLTDREYRGLHSPRPGPEIGTPKNAYFCDLDHLRAKKSRGL